MACRKIRYRTRVDAMLALVSTERAARRGNGRRDEIRYYRCPRCRGWHLTSEA